MNHRTLSQPTSSAVNCFGLVAWLEQTRIHLPLKGVECRFHVCGDLLNVEIDQIFHQNAPQPLDCLYTFPLPANAAVYRCEMYVNGRVIRARVEERNQARKLVRAQKAAGRRTTLVEMERENLFTLSLGNLQPGDVVVIRFAYFETLTRLADWTSLRIPFCPGVRYIPGEPLLRSLSGKGVDDDTDQVPDASRLSPPRIDALHPDAAYLSVTGIVENPLGLLSDLSSASHPVVVTDGDKKYQITLAIRETVPDSDFSVRWTESRAPQMQSAAWAASAGRETFALIQLHSPKIAAPVASAAQDFYFLVDRSGSMEGLKWEKAVQSFGAFLQQLGPEDRIWITFFSDRFQDFAEKPLTVLEIIADSGLSVLQQLGANGGTQLLPALRHVLQALQRHSADRKSAIILITDGQIGNEAAILTEFRAQPAVRVHTFGIDTTVNDALLTRLAAQQRGACCLLQATDDIVGAVTRLANRLRRPVLTSLSVSGGWEIPAGALPDLHAEECFSLSFKSNVADAKEVVIKGRLPDGREEIFHFPLVQRDEPAIRLLWSRSRIRYLLDEGQPDRAIALAKEANLLCDGAAFVAWDEAEEVAIAKQEIYQPSLLAEVKRDTMICRDSGSGSPSPLRCEYLCQPTSFDGHELMSPPYRHHVLYTGSPITGALEHLTALLGSRPHLDGKQFQRDFGPQLGLWSQRFSESYAFCEVPTVTVIRNMLIEWVADGGVDQLRRMSCLEELINKLELEGPNPEAGFAILRHWIDQTMAKDDPFRPKLQAVLDTKASPVVDPP